MDADGGVSLTVRRVFQPGLVLTAVETPAGRQSLTSGTLLAPDVDIFWKVSR